MNKIFWQKKYIHLKTRFPSNFFIQELNIFFSKLNYVLSQAQSFHSFEPENEEYFPLKTDPKNRIQA